MTRNDLLSCGSAAKGAMVARLVPVVGGVMLLALACADAEDEPAGAGPQFPAPVAAIERAQFNSLAEAYEHADLVVVATAGRFEATDLAETSGGRRLGGAWSELRTEAVLKGEPTDPVFLGMPSGEDHRGLDALNDVLAGRRGLFLLMSEVSAAERGEIMADGGTPGLHILANTQSAILDGGPDGTYALYSTEESHRPFPADIEGMPFDDLVALVEVLG